MRRCLPALLLALAAVPAPAATEVGTWSDRVSAQWWNDHSTPASWHEERASIHRQLLEVHKRLGTYKAINNEHFAGWMNHLQWLTLFAAAGEDSLFGDPQARATYVALARTPEPRNLFLASLSPYDDQPRALENLCRISLAHPAAAREFPALAVAISIVFDQPFPDSWPHHFVEPDQVPRVDEKPEDRFRFFVDSQEAGALMFDLKRLSVPELKFVVDSPVSLEELHYVQGVKMRAIKQFHTLFSMIEYDRARLASQEYLWPHGAYQLASIARHGGLCIDQAYYTSHAAKAKGVPNIVFLGQGNSGEHAWMGYLESYGRWRFDLAKFRNEDYPVGQAFDPQTWRRLTDSECRFLNRRPTTTASFRTARDYLTWAALNPDATFHQAALQLARKTAPQYLWAWELEAACLARTEADLPTRTRFWHDWIAAFQNQNDLRFRGEKRLLGLLEEAGQSSDYNRLLRRIIASNKNQRFDLVVSVAAEKVFVHLENKRWEQAHRTFRGAMQKLAGSAGGHLFYQLVQPYVQSCLEEGKLTYAREAMERAAKAFEAQEGSILDQDLRQLAALVDARKGR